MQSANVNADDRPVNHEITSGRLFVQDTRGGPWREVGTIAAFRLEPVPAVRSFFHDDHVCPYGHGCIDERRCGRKGHCAHADSR